MKLGCLRNGMLASSLPAAALAVLLLPAAPARAQYDLPPSGNGGLMWLVSPLLGCNRDELKRRDQATGRPLTARKTAAEYGLFALLAQPRFVVNDFLFFTEAAADTDVMGNFLHANLYGAPAAAVTWNLGAGHLYHKIESRHEQIEVQVPMVKAGPLFRLARWGLTFNPYVGHAWERIDTRHGDMENDSWLYGLTMDWRWRMVGFNAKYYCLDGRDLDEHFHNVHLRLTTGFTPRWGAALRCDHMEHVTTDDTSLLVGPFLVF